MALTEQQLNAISITERVNSAFSVLGTSIVIGTFLGSRSFRKPINRVVFYASWGNIFSNIATMISRSSIITHNLSLCHFQAFLIQVFMPADALWTFAMAFNVYLTFFHKYDATKLKRLEWVYITLCYGLPFIPGFVYFFVHSESKGPIYGSAVLWCWISIEWDILRIAVFYAPVWFVILLTFTIYIYVGIDILRKRRQLRSFQNDSSHLESRTNNMFEIHASKVVHITSEEANGPIAVNHNRTNSTASSSSLGTPTDTEHVSGKLEDKTITIGKSTNNAKRENYTAYSVTVERGDGNSGPASAGLDVGNSELHVSSISRRPPPRVEANQANSAAAYAYFKYAMLYFIALLVTWVPSTINRVYTLIYPDTVNFGMEFVSAFVLPLQGLWNSIIYIAVSWSTVMELYRRWQERRQRSSRGGNMSMKMRHFGRRKSTLPDSSRVTRSAHGAVSGDSESTRQFASDNAGVNGE